MSGKRSALIVATSEYRDSRLATLEGPGRDADALRTVLANKQIGDFDVRVALNSRVDILRRTLETFFTDRDRDDLLLVHFSGHGLKDDDGQLYLAAADTQLDRLLSTGIDASWINRLMSKCRSEKIALFLDCCFAGAFTSGMTRRAAGDRAGVKEQFNGSGLFVITASDAMQYSFEGGKQIGQPPEPSPFTRALVDGLVSGEADRNEDGEVSINELFDFLEDRIRETSPSQTPTKSSFNQVGDWSIARSTRAPSVRLLPAELQAQLKSDNPLDRIGAIFDLRDLIGGPDSRLADAATQALERLAQDDSRTVAARAQRVIDEEAARPRSAARGVRRRPTSATESAPDQATEPAPPAEEQPAAIAADTPPLGGVLPAPAIVADAPPIAAVLPAAAIAAAAPEPEAEPAPTRWAAAPVVEPVGEGFAAAVARNPALEPSAAARQTPGGNSQADTLPPTPEKSAGIPWSLRRAASRVAIGSFVGVMFEYGWVLGNNSSIFDSPSDLDTLSQLYGEWAAIITIVATAIIATAELLVPSLRLAGGSAYGFAGGNRWVAAAALGVVSAVVINPVLSLVRYGTLDGYGGHIVVCTVIGFVIAEALVGNRFRQSAGQQTVAA